MKKKGYVYILSNKENGTLYVGVTSNLHKRIYEHKNNLIEGFTKEYQVHKLVYYEVFEEIIPAIEREKQLKHWNRKWKLRIINEANPIWRDLYDELL